MKTLYYIFLLAIPFSAFSKEILLVNEENEVVKTTYQPNKRSWHELLALMDGNVMEGELKGYVVIPPKNS